MTARPRDFGDDLQASHAWADAPWWLEVYRKAFPTLVAMPNTRGFEWAQRGGIDRQLVLASGKTIAIDEKVRQQDYDDIALEYLHVYESGARKDGWVKKDLACDFIAYAFIPSRRCYLLPFHTLRRAWLDMGKYWHEQGADNRAGFHIADSRNAYNGSRWRSLSVCVPIPVLMSALKEAMIVRWTDEPQPPLDTQTTMFESERR